MIKRLLLGVLLNLIAISAFATTTQIVGTLVDATGNPLNGVACFKLPVNAIDTSTGRALSPVQVCFNVTNGTFPAFANLTPNDVIQPLNTYYQVTVRNSSRTLIFNANYVIPTGGGTFNIGQAIPTTVTTSNISYLSPALLNVSQVWTAIQIFPVNSIAVNELVVGTNGQCVQTVAGVAAWATCGTGTTITVNGGATAGTVNFGNLPAASANNLLGVWQYSGGNASVQVPITGNGSVVMSATGIFTAGNIVITDVNHNAIDSGKQPPFVQKIKKVGGCSTGGGSNSACQDTLTWPVTFGTTAYVPVCQGLTSAQFTGQSTTNQAAVLVIDSYTATQVVVTTETMRSLAAQFSEIDCIGVL